MSWMPTWMYDKMMELDSNTMGETKDERHCVIEFVKDGSKRGHFEDGSIEVVTWADVTTTTTCGFLRGTSDDLAA